MAFKPLQIIIGAKDEASAVFGRLQTKVAAVGVAIAGYFGIQLFKDAVQSAADFEAAMSRVEAATGATGQELEDLKTAAADAGASSAFNAVQAAGALENLAKAGLSGKEAIQALNPVLSLAAAADVELATAAEYVTKAVMGMGLSFDDAGRVADVLAKGANASNTSVSGLAEALSYTAPIAKTVGVSLEETVAIIGKLADSGIDASRAGTALNNILAQFSDPASKFKRELAAAGITTTDFGDALRQLEAAGPKGEAAIRAVGLEAGPALRSLLNQGTAALDGLTQKLRDSSGSAAEAAAVMQNNLQGSMKGLGSVWESVKNALATPVLPVLTGGVRELTDALRASIADGTVGRFGQTLKTAFESGIKGLKDFIGTLDVNAIIAKLQGWAAQTQVAFSKIAEYAATAGGTVQTAWGVMSAGTNTVMAVIYKVAEAFAGVASNIQSGLAVLYEGMSKITFGPISAAYKKAADEIRISAEATGAVSEAFANKASAAFDAAANGAETARAGWAALTETAETTAPAIDSVAASNQALADTAKKSAESQDQQAQAVIKNADAAAKNAAEIQVLRAEYDALVQGGNLQAAAQKLQEIDRRLSDVDASAQKAAASQKDVEDAFARLGVQSSAALQNLANEARSDFELIRESGTASARDVREAFRIAAQAAIDAADGIAPAWVRAEAAQRGYVVQVDESGKSVIKLASEINNAAAATGNLQGAWQGVGAAIEDAAEKAKRVKKESADAAEAAETAKRERVRAQSMTVKLGTNRKDYFDFAKSRGASDEQALAYANERDANKISGGMRTTSGARHLVFGQIARDKEITKKLDDAILASVQKNIATQSSAQPTTPATTQQPPSGVTTYVSNITLPSGKTAQVRFADGVSQSQAEEILRQLAAAKGAAA